MLGCQLYGTGQKEDGSRSAKDEIEHERPNLQSDHVMGDRCAAHDSKSPSDHAVKGCSVKSAACRAIAVTLDGQLR
jgi:hypothetical protein